LYIAQIVLVVLVIEKNVKYSSKDVEDEDEVEYECDFDDELNP